MKKACKLLLVGAALATTMTVSAAAANFTAPADALNQMGLLSGTGSGYELDRAPTRAEAAVMLVRLLGGEKAAVENNYKTPFTDVPNWAAPYVGWLYQNGLTAGATATTYGTDDKCTAQMYSAFLLRTLGYKDSGSATDFQYAKAISFAEEKGVADSINYSATNFLRDHVAAMSYTALSVQPKDQKNETLLDQLISSGAIDAKKAAATKSNFSAYKEYVKLNQADAATDSVAMDMKMKMGMKLNGTDMMNVLADLDVKAKIDLNKMDQSKLAMTGKMSATLSAGLLQPGESTNQTADMKAYYTNGAYYINAGTEKYKMPMSFEDTMAGLDMTETADSPITMFKSIEKNSNGSYKLAFAPGLLNNTISNALEATGMVANDAVNISKFDVVVTPKNGKVSTMTADVACSVSAEGQKLEMALGIDYNITARGDQVTIVLPTDLNTYAEMPIA